VSAGDGDAKSRHPQELTEHLRSRDYRNFQGTRRADFRIRKFHGGRNNYGVELGPQMIRMVAAFDRDTETCEARGRGAIVQVAAAHFEAEALT
jgi:hypothetical protein